MDDTRSDAAAVAAFVAGDRSALGEIYDRYAAALLDLATGMLRDPHDAADVVQDVFVVAARSLHRLREPDRLRPWLFAIARHEVFRRTRSRSRTRATDFSDPAAAASLGAATMSAPVDPAAEAGRLVALDLAASIRAAAAGLDPRDQLVLELVARSGLRGRDLADALGVSEAQSQVLVHRMRERVRRSLGAWTVARMGRADCPTLQEVLAGWDGAFSVLIRKRVARHVDSCAVCAQTSQRYAVIPLLGLLPVLAAPAELRGRVLSAALGGGVADPAVDQPPESPGTAAYQRAGRPAPENAYRFDAPGGFPAAARGPRRVLAAVLAAGVLALLIGGGWWVRAAIPVTSPTLANLASTPSTPSTPSGPASPAPAPASEASADAAPSTVPSQPSRPSGSTAPSSPPTSSPAGPTLPAPGRLVLGASTVAVGTGSKAGLELRNTGGRPVTWSITDALAPFVLSASSGQLAPGQSMTVQVGIDRTGLPEGQVEVRFQVRSSALGGGGVLATAGVDRAPQVGLLAPPPTLLTCPWSVGPMVAVTVLDESPVTDVRLAWAGPGASGGTPLTKGSTGAWTGRLGVSAVVGSWTWTITATDARGNTGTASGTTLVRGTC